MKTIIGIVVVVAGIGMIYYLYKNKTLVNILSKQTDATAKTNETASVPKKESLITHVKNADGTIPVVTPPVVTLRYTSKIGLTFNGGQSIYENWDGVKFSATVGTHRGIGYLTDGTLLHTGNTVYGADGEYLPIKVVVVDGIDLKSFIGSLNVDGVIQSVYGVKSGVNLWEFFGAIGFLANGNTVFREVINAGQPDEYSYYRT